MCGDHFVIIEISNHYVIHLQLTRCCRSIILQLKEIVSRHRKQTYDYQRETGEKDKLGIWEQHIHTIMYKIDKQGPTV